MENFTADQILSMGSSRARSAIGLDGIGKLLKRWHPDVNADPKARQVFDKLMTWRSVLKGAPSEPLEFPTLWGTRRVEEQTWSAVFSAEPDLADVFADNLRRVHFADTKMAEEMKRAIPRKMRRDIEGAGIPSIILPRGGQAVLADWVSVHGAPEPEHLAWIGSGLLNIAAWAQWANCVLPGLSVETVSIDPVKHQVSLPFGWEMAAFDGERPVVVSDAVLGLFPSLAAPGRPVPEALTLELVKQTLRDLAGDSSGQDLARSLPSGMVSWIQAPSRGKVVEAYRGWLEALTMDFGPRRFVKWAKTVQDVYPDY